LTLLFTPPNNVLIKIFACSPPTVFEVVALMWNSEAFSIQLHLLLIVIPIFCDAIDCLYKHIKHLLPATAGKIEKLITSMQSELLKIICWWERSGQGEGGLSTDKR
jgi:hypothetical protein